MQGDFFFSKLINVHARLFDTLEYVMSTGSIANKISPKCWVQNGPIFKIEDVKHP